jgi:hypothetical protein
MTTPAPSDPPTPDPVPAPPPAPDSVPAAAPEPAAVSDVTPEDLLWQQTAAELTPAKSLAQVDDRAKQIINDVALIAAILTGLGALTGSQLASVPAAKALAIATMAVTWSSVLLAVGALLLRLSSAITPGNLLYVKQWYESQFQRARLVAAAGWLSLGGLCLAGVTALLLLLLPASAATTDRPSVAVSLVGGTLDVQLTFPGLPAGTDVQAGVTGAGPDASGAASNAVLARASALAGASGTASVSLTVPGIDTGNYQTLSVTAAVAGGTGYACQGTVPVAESNGSVSNSPVSLSCTRR